MSIQTVPARRGAATIVRKDQTIKIINTHGNQVVDTWAIAIHTTTPSAADPAAPLFPRATSTSPASYSSGSNNAASRPEYMSMCHSRASLLKLTPTISDVLVSQKRRPMLEVVEDTSPGVHDTLIAACDRWRYEELGCEGYHESCTDNFWDALIALVAQHPEIEGLQNLPSLLGGRVPDPFNLFMNIPVTSEGVYAKRGLSFDPPVTKTGDSITLRAKRDLVIIMSACPQDVLSINGKSPVEAHFRVS